MRKFLLITFAIISSQLSFGQTNDLTIDSLFNRFNVGGFYSQGIEYFRLPQDQIRPLYCSVLISNTGTNDITNCYLKVDVKFAGSIIMTEYSDSVNINSGNQDSLFLTAQFDFVGQPQGMYTLVYRIDSDSLELNLTDNVDSLNFEITQNLLTRSNFSISDSSNNYHQDSLSGFGYVFRVENDACLSAVYPWLSFDPVNSSIGIGGVTATLFVLDSTSNSYNFAAGSSAEIPVSASDMGGTIEIPFASFNDLVAGNTYLVTINSEFHDFYLSQYSIDSTIYLSYYSGTIGSFKNDLNAPLVNSRMIKMDIAFNGGPYCNLGNIKENEIKINVFPNPSNSWLTVDGLNSEFTYQVYSILGQILLEGNSGSHGFSIESLSFGEYILKLTANGEVYTKKFTKT